MNERITQLLTQAGVGDNWNESDWYSLSPEMVEKFAELIVRECAEIADTERSNSVGCGYITKTNGMRIKEHFGVDE
jgi:hypothetical protein